MGLAEENCSPGAAGIPLSTREVNELAPEVPQWSVKDQSVTREFEFPDFQQAMGFVNRTARLAESQGHHPDMAISYRRVRVALSTHKIGGLSRNDFILAARIDRMEKGRERPAPGAKGLRGQTALVTGAAKRVGRQIALALAEEGVNIVIHYRTSAEEAGELCAEITARGVRAFSVQADFGVPAEYENLIRRAQELSGSLGFLINSASIFLPSTIPGVAFKDLMEHMEINAWVPFVLSREFARRAGSGKIVNLLDTRVQGYDWSHVAYILSKQVLSILTRMIAVELAPQITVNAVAPGLILPPPGKDESDLEEMAKTVPLRRHGNPGDIVDAILYLLKSDFVTGQVIHVDGGRHIMEYGRGPHPDS